jgi:hypothetical protein
MAKEHEKCQALPKLLQRLHVGDLQFGHRL